MTTHTQNDGEFSTWFEDLHEEAIRAIDKGWNVIPISVASKKPLIGWKEYQTKSVELETVEDWFENGVETSTGHRVKTFNLAVLTGAISGIVVVDCDNIESVRYLSLIHI